jgi:ABC-type glycerol-3-phosphate transport system permease component
MSAEADWQQCREPLEARSGLGMSAPWTCLRFAVFVTTRRQRRTRPVILGACSVKTAVSWSSLIGSIAIGLVPTLPLAFPIRRSMVRVLTSGAIR